MFFLINRIECPSLSQQVPDARCCADHVRVFAAHESHALAAEKLARTAADSGRLDERLAAQSAAISTLASFVVIPVLMLLL